MDDSLRRLLLPRTALAGGNHLADDAHALIGQQRSTWDLASRGYASLDSVETRVFPFDGFRVVVQFNPGRITSSSAKVDEKSIRERKCFLCPAHLPEAQRGFLYRDDYLFLANPFPIFPEHFTVPHRDHLPQGILPALDLFLGLTEDLAPRYTVVYNGPKCGASAPDHLHLQAGTAGFMPFEHEVRLLRSRLGIDVASVGDLRAFAFREYLRTFIAIESTDLPAIARGFRALYAAYEESSGTTGEEPLMNLIAFRSGELYTLAMFARTKHRPSFFFLEGDERMMLSPACVDVGGVLTLPIERDYRRMSGEIITRMFEEVHLSSGSFAALQDAAAKRIRSL